MLGPILRKHCGSGGCCVTHEGSCNAVGGFEEIFKTNMNKMLEGHLFQEVKGIGYLDQKGIIRKNVTWQSGLYCLLSYQGQK